MMPSAVLSRDGCGVLRLVPARRRDEAGEYRVRLERLGLEFRMELNRQVPGVTGKLDDFHELPVGRPTRDPEPSVGQRAFVRAVELVAVTVALVHERRAVHL